jgi:hypothetical protein
MKFPHLICLAIIVSEWKSFYREKFCFFVLFVMSLFLVGVAGKSTLINSNFQVPPRVIEIHPKRNILFFHPHAFFLVRPIHA